MKRVTIEVQRLSFGTLFKIFALGGLGFCLPFCALAGLIGVLSPHSVQLKEGATLTGFYASLIFLPILWPLLFALFFSCAAWFALKVKSLFSNTVIEVIQPENPLGPQAPIQPPQTTTGSSAPDRV